MSTAFHLDRDALAGAAKDLLAAMQSFREFEDGHYEARLVDIALEKLNPILDLCIKRELEEPFDFVGYMGRLMGDDLGFPEITKPYYRLCELASGGIPPLDFCRTEFHRRMPRQLRRPPEYQPSEAEQKRIEADLKLKSGG